MRMEKQSRCSGEVMAGLSRIVELERKVVR